MKGSEVGCWPGGGDEGIGELAGADERSGDGLWLMVAEDACVAAWAGEYCVVSFRQEGVKLTV